MGFISALRPLAVGAVILVFLWPTLMSVLIPMVQLATSGTMFGNITLGMFLLIGVAVVFMIFNRTREAYEGPGGGGLQLVNPPTNLGDEQFR